MTEEQINLNAEIELRHIQLELINGRTQHFRHFIDQYYCYKNGFVAITGKACWHKIPFSSKVYKTQKALDNFQLYNEGKLKGKKSLYWIQKEHIIPLNYLTKLLLDSSPKFKLSSLKSILDEHLIFATISKEEDKLLDKLGLKSSMPAEYFDTNSILYLDKFARYKKAGIQLIK